MPNATAVNVGAIQEEQARLMVVPPSEVAY